MNIYPANEILINAIRVMTHRQLDIYEFVLNDTLHVIECVHVESLTKGLIFPVQNFHAKLHNVLFELNHVRVNPRLDNTFIISCLTNALSAIGVNVHNAPNHQSMAMCYRPLGEITENVRFYFTESGQCVFLCPNAKLKVVPPLTRQHGYNAPRH